MTDWIEKLLTIYGPVALPVIGLVLAVRYLLAKEKERIDFFLKTLSTERDRNEELRRELIAEIRANNIILVNDFKRALEIIVAKS